MSIQLLEHQFDKDAKPIIPAEEPGIINALTAAGNPFTDVVVISHGWNNDIDDARTLYRNFFRALEVVAPAAAKTTLAVCVLWPSKKFTDAELIPGGAASADSDPVADAQLLDRLEQLKSVFGDEATDRKLDTLKSLIPGLTLDSNRQQQFVSVIGAILDQSSDSSQRSEDEGTATVSSHAASNGGPKLLKTLGTPILPRVVAGGGGAAGIGGGGLSANPALRKPGVGGSAGIGDFFSGVKAGALRLLNYVTYYTMKDRAGKIGAQSLNPLLARIQSAAPKTLRFHLVGHSFGGRVVTAAIDGPNKLRVDTLLLMQAAYSHNGLSSDFDPNHPGRKGFFHAVLDQHKVSGPILITHSKNDSAVGLAYPLASRLNGDDAAGVGDANDIFGGMGASGAQRVDKLDTQLLATGGKYDFTSSGKRVFNLNGDSIIQSHGDVTRPETAAVLAQAMSLAAQPIPPKL